MKTPTQTITHFRTQKTALLLAYLAAHLHQTHPREMLIDLLWQESDLDTGRTSLRVALSSLRKQFEQAGMPPDALLYSDNWGIGLRSESVTTDLREMERYIRLAHRTSDEPERLVYLRHAIDLYTDVPLKGFYEEWVLQLQQQTMERYFCSLDELLALLEKVGDRDTAQEYALQGIARDPLREEPRRALMRLYLAMGYPAEAKRVYQDWEELVCRELGAVPSPAMQHVAQQAESAAQGMQDSIRLFCESKLPSTPGRLLGRERETAHLLDLLGMNTTRLVTITGEGGIGKTSLAIEVARRSVSKGQRVWFVEVAEVSQAPALLEDILNTIGVARYMERRLDAAIQALGGYPSLLVLDNFEQVDTTGAEVISELLQSLPLLQLLVTSRRKIGLPGEQVVRLSPLETPFAQFQRGGQGENLASPEALEGCPSVQLFVQQAQRVRTEFRLVPENALAVAEICERLEGVPLAVVLAASRVRVLSPHQILHAVRQQMDVLSQPHASCPDRHRSLHASLEWSYALLSPELKRAFTMISVFQGGWDLGAARCVLTGHLPAGEDTVDVAVLDILDALIECSLVRVEEQGEQARYRMLEVVRRYALEKLQAEPYADDAFARHFLFYSDFASRANQNRLGVQATQWATQVVLEHQNVVAAIEYALSRDNARASPSALRMAADLWVFWMMHGRVVEGGNILQRLLTEYRDIVCEEGSHWWAWVAMGAGALAWMQSELAPAEQMLRQSLSRFEQEGDVEGQAFATIWLGNVLYRAGDYGQAEAIYTRSAVLAEQASNLEAQTYAAMWLGNLAQRAGDYERARAIYQSCLRMAEQTSDQYALGFVHYNLGQIALREENYTECARRVLHCLRIRAAIDDQPGFLEATESLVLLLAHRAQGDAGAQLAGACRSFRQRLHLPPSSQNLHEAEHLLRRQLGEARYQQQVAQGRSLSMRDISALAESTCNSLGG